MVFCNEGDAMKLAIGCDEAACDPKTAAKQHPLAQGHEVADFGTHDGEPVLYPDIGIAVAQAIVQGRHERGVLLCGTGIGMAIAANKVAGIRAAQAHDTYSAERASRSRSEEHTSELQSQSNLVCRLLLEKKKKTYNGVWR